MLLAAALMPPICARSQALAPSGCPINHCTSEYTGLIHQPLITTVVTAVDNDSLGSLQAEGCSGNGARLACLYIRDAAPASRRGTLKILNANTLKPIWGSASAPDSFDLDPHSAADGQVPVFFSNGSIAAGDANNYVLYSSSGAVLGTLPVGGQGNDLGLIPISPTYGIVSQGDGVLTLVNLDIWEQEGSLILTDPATQTRVNLVGPSTGTANVLYTIGYDAQSGTGVLYSVVVNETGQLAIRSTFSFAGQSGASPVVITPSISGLPTNLILLHVPGLLGEAQRKDRLLALSDTGAPEFEQTWEISLATPVAVAPTVDPSSQSIFYEGGERPSERIADRCTDPDLQYQDHRWLFQLVQARGPPRGKSGRLDVCAVARGNLRDIQERRRTVRHGIRADCFAFLTGMGAADCRG